MFDLIDRLGDTTSIGLDTVQALKILFHEVAVAALYYMLTSNYFFLFGGKFGSVRILGSHPFTRLIYSVVSKMQQYFFTVVYGLRCDQVHQM